MNIIERRRSMTHCLNGHRYTPETVVIDTRGCRRCRTCRRTRDAADRMNRLERQRRHRATANQTPRPLTTQDGLSRHRIPVEPLLQWMAKHDHLISHQHPSVERALTRSKSLGYISYGYVDDIALPVFDVHPFQIYGPEWFAWGNEYPVAHKSHDEFCEDGHCPEGWYVSGEEAS